MHDEANARAMKVYAEIAYQIELTTACLLAVSL